MGTGHGEPELWREGADGTNFEEILVFDVTRSYSETDGPLNKSRNATSLVSHADADVASRLLDHLCSLN